ncbi:MAG TPA: pyridoxamine 5'-phosphate oxidase family protein [Micromonosporaceae bacterium]|nr:pyridoxamine 5'-phosphate oxidase family protein [Micromonosporaceae bacterium]
MIHHGELAVQRRAGLTVDHWGSAGVGAEIPAVAADFLRQQRMLVLGALDDAGAVWATAVGGPAGFAEPTDERHVTIAALPGPADPLHGLFDTEREVGMLAIEPRTRRRMRINGYAQRAGNHHLVVRTDQVYANCPKYIQTRDPEPDDTPTPEAATEWTRTRELSDAQQRWIIDADTFFVATQAPGHGADASHRGGNPGFVRLTGPHRLVWPDYVGNSMFMTLGNLALDPRCGLLFLDWTRGDALHLTGRARVDWDERRIAAVPGAQRLIEFDIDTVVEVRASLPVRWRFGHYSRFNPPINN